MVLKEERTSYQCRWSATSDCLLRRFSKINKRYYKINIPSEVWRSIIQSTESVMPMLSMEKHHPEHRECYAHAEHTSR